MTRILRRILGDERGATAMEYGLIAALIAMVLVGGLSTLGPVLENNFNNIADEVDR